MRRSVLLRLCALGCIALAVAAAGCRQDMHDQPKYIPLRPTDFFTDHRSERPLVDDTVARSDLRADPLLDTGKEGGKDADVFPFPITEQIMKRGQERFNIFCSPCHGRTGRGDGMVVRRGYRRPPSYFDPRLVNAPLGHFFDVMTNGFGSMPDYAAQVPVEDRWAIVAYIRALQASETATTDDVPAEELKKLQEMPAQAPQPQAGGQTAPPGGQPQPGGTSQEAGKPKGPGK